MSLTYAVIGSGAIGGFYGGMLAKAGFDVHFLFHNDYKYVCDNGLRVDSVLGDFLLSGVNAYDYAFKMPKVDVVLVCLKTTANALLKDLLPPLLHEKTCVVLIQNGLGVEEQFVAHFPHLPVSGGLAYVCSSRVAPGHVVHLDHGKITLGAFQSDQSEWVRQVCGDFKSAGVPAEFTENLKESRWKKLVWNIPYNGLCVVLNATTEQLMSCPETVSLLRSMMLEVIGAANACGVSIDVGLAQSVLDMTRKMKPYAPSMKLDYDFKRPMEIEAIYTAPLREAYSVGFEMPKVAMLEQQLRFIQLGYL